MAAFVCAKASRGWSSAPRANKTRNAGLMPHDGEVRNRLPKCMVFSSGGLRDIVVHAAAGGISRDSHHRGTEVTEKSRILPGSQDGLSKLLSTSPTQPLS